MTAFDTDVLSDLLTGRADYLKRLDPIPEDRRFVPIVAVAEVFRGWLAAIRAAEAGRGGVSLELAFRQVDRSVRGLTGYHTLAYTADAHARFETFRAAKLRIGTHDLRIAAICFGQRATLVTRNARDYALVPGLTYAVWP